MAPRPFPLFCALVLLSTAGVRSESDRLREQIYVELGASAMCFRLLNATHEIGCQSERDGSVGTVQLIETAGDWHRFDLAGGGSHSDDGRAPYVIAVDVHLFHGGNVSEVLRTSELVSGVLLLWNETGGGGAPRTSADYTCPNARYGLYPDDHRKCGVKSGGSVWNPTGNPTLFHSWHKPIFLIQNETDLRLVKECHLRHNVPNDGRASRPLCAARLKAFMYGAHNAPTCMRRNTFVRGFRSSYTGRCGPVGNKQIFAILPERSKAEGHSNKSILLIGTKMDTLSLLSDVSPGAETAVTSVITLLAASRALGAHRAQLSDAGTANNRSVALALFNGESLDYLGSTRMLYDMEQGAFPLAVSEASGAQPAPIDVRHLAGLIYVEQIARHVAGREDLVYAHFDAKNYAATQEAMESMSLSLQRHMAAAGLDLSYAVGRANESGVLPPCSAHTFVRRAPLVPAMVISGYERSYHTEQYNGFGDTAAQYPSRRAAVRRIARVAQSLVDHAARWLRGGAGGRAGPLFRSNISVDEELVDTLFSCLAGGRSLSACAMYKRMPKVENPYLGRIASVTADKTYAGPERHLSQIAFFSSQLFAVNFGRINATAASQEECRGFFERGETLYSYTWTTDPYNSSESASHCYGAPVYFTSSQSPAFAIDGYSYASNEYPSWVEPYWGGDTGVQLYLSPTSGYETWTLLGGIAVLVVSLAVTFWVEASADALFVKHRGTV